eukprot:TRINITY_DN20871_c0_g1_i1.p1 TRINITY_DN20871_c0_g1~~TRINITY_DN20871_c0_g1_i1.p1  ORF type:complete len:277 (-),score=59.96 TRINITY_DN20871_c0_g1_i1:286-1116(-)
MDTIKTADSLHHAGSLMLSKSKPLTPPTIRKPRAAYINGFVDAKPAAAPEMPLSMKRKSMFRAGTSAVARMSVCLSGAGARKSVFNLGDNEESRCDIAKQLLTCAAHKDAPHGKLLSQLQVLFDTIDSNGDGSLDIEEFVESMVLLCVAKTPDEAVAMFLKADTDHSGAIRFEVFKKWLVQKWGSLQPEVMLERVNNGITTVKKIRPQTPAKAALTAADAQADLVRLKAQLDTKGAIEAKKHMITRINKSRSEKNEQVLIRARSSPAMLSRFSTSS